MTISLNHQSTTYTVPITSAEFHAIVRGDIAAGDWTLAQLILHGILAVLECSYKMVSPRSGVIEIVLWGPGDNEAVRAKIVNTITRHIERNGVQVQ